MKTEFNTVVKMVSALETDVKSLRSFTVDSVVTDSNLNSSDARGHHSEALVLTPLLEELRRLNHNFLDVHGRLPPDKNQYSSGNSDQKECPEKNGDSPKRDQANVPVQASPQANENPSDSNNDMRS